MKCAWQQAVLTQLCLWLPLYICAWCYSGLELIFCASPCHRLSLLFPCHRLSLLFHSHLVSLELQQPLLSFLVQRLLDQRTLLRVLVSFTSFPFHIVVVRSRAANLCFSLSPFFLAVSLPPAFLAVSLAFLAVSFSSLVALPSILFWCRLLPSCLVKFHKEPSVTLQWAQLPYSLPSSPRQVCLQD